MDEFALINRYFAKAQVNDDVVLGIGDDCAIVQIPPGRQLVMSIDTMVAGVHFPHETRPEHIASRALCGALSDLAAMGAKPHWFTLALTLPEADAHWIDAFSQGLLSSAEQFHCCLIGGDTTRGPLTISVQVHGSVTPGLALLRRGAQVEDTIYVTGSLGDGAAALALLQQQLSLPVEAQSYLQSRFYSPCPRILDGQLLAGTASAAIDVSDGLCADLSKICEASGVGALVDVSLLPIASLWRDSVGEGTRIGWALAGGDDYQLCFTVPAQQVGKVERWVAAGELCATAIGKITEGCGLRLQQNGLAYEPESEGYNHFG